MGKAVRKKELVRSIYYEQDMDKEKVQMFVLEDVFDLLIENIRECITGDERVYLRGFGTFSPIRFNLTKKRFYNRMKGECDIALRLNHERVFTASPMLLRKINTGSKDVFQRYFNDSDNT